MPGSSFNGSSRFIVLNQVMNEVAYALTVFGRQRPLNATLAKGYKRSDTVTH